MQVLSKENTTLRRDLANKQYDYEAKLAESNAAREDAQRKIVSLQVSVYTCVYTACTSVRMIVYYVYVTYIHLLIHIYHTLYTIGSTLSS